MDVSGMGLYGFVGILSVVLGLIKEVVTILLIFKGIQVANTYINKNDKSKGKDLDKGSENKAPVELEEDQNEKHE